MNSVPQPTEQEYAPEWRCWIRLGHEYGTVSTANNVLRDGFRIWKRQCAKCGRWDYSPEDFCERT